MHSNLPCVKVMLSYALLCSVMKTWTHSINEKWPLCSSALHFFKWYLYNSFQLIFICHSENCLHSMFQPEEARSETFCDVIHSFHWAANLYETKLCNYELPLDSLVRCTLCKESPIPDTNGLIVVGLAWLQWAVWFPCRKGNSISHRIGLNSLQQEQWAKDGKECIFHEGIINLSQLLKLVGNYGMTLNGGLRGKALFVLGLF